MRGPLLSGAIGSPAALERLCAILRAKPPTVVLSSVWLAAELSSEIPVLLLAEPEQAKGVRRTARKAGLKLQAVLAGETVPLAAGSVGAIVLENVLEIEEPELPPFLVGLAAALRSDGVIVALDGTKDPAAEARVAGAYLAAGLRDIAQERPREGALLTIGGAPPAPVLSALSG